MDTYKIPFSEIKICGHDEAEKTVKEEPNKWNVVSICVPPSDLNKKLFVDSDLGKAKSYCRVHFHDVSTEGCGFVLCNSAHIEKVLNYTRKINNEPLLIHCAAGISRSTAMATLIILDRIKDLSEWPGEDAADIVKHYRRVALPNNYVLNIGVPLIARNTNEQIKWFREIYNSNLWK